MADPGGEAPETHARPAPSETYAANTRRDSWRESWVSAETHGGDSRSLTRRETGGVSRRRRLGVWLYTVIRCLAAAIVSSIITRFRYILLHCGRIVPWLSHDCGMLYQCVPLRGCRRGNHQVIWDTPDVPRQIGPVWLPSQRAWTRLNKLECAVKTNTNYAN